MSDPNPAVADRSIPLPVPLLRPRPRPCSSPASSTAEDLARAVAEEVGQDPRPDLHPPGHPRHLPRPGPQRRPLLPRRASTRLLAWRTARGLPACSPDTGGYCKARQRLPETLLPRLVRDTADGLQDNAPEAWLFHGRRVVLADGSTVSMPDTPENQAEYPQHGNQKPGCGFPIARIVVLISLATGCVLDAAIGAGKGKLTGEMALIRAPARPAEAGRHPAGRQLLQLVRRGGDAGGDGRRRGDAAARRAAGATSAAARGWAARTTWSSGSGAATGRRG